MKPICNFCGKQESGAVWEGTVRCGAAKYEMKGEYGPFKQGAVCVYDSDLSDRFVPRTGEESSVLRMSKLLADQEKALSRLRDENATLKERLTRIE